MSWFVNVTGNHEEVGKAFDAQHEQMASGGMIESELVDIDTARDFAVQLANQYGLVHANASGHWITAGGGNEPVSSRFGRVTVTIEKAAPPAAKE